MSICLSPAPANTGIVFKRIDLEGFQIEAQVRHVARVSYATSLMKKGVLISTVEHLMSALAGMELDNVCVEIDNLEVPILDGSAKPFVELIKKAGRRRQRARRLYAKILKPIELTDGVKRIAVYPADGLRLTCGISFSHPLIGRQTTEFVSGHTDYARDVAPARTFGFLAEVEALRKSGLIRGGSLENAVVLTRDGVLNPEGLRFADEFSRHKVLDLIGDLALLGMPIIGRVEAERAGHAMHVALTTRLLQEKDVWTPVRQDELAYRPTETPAFQAVESLVSPQ